jgi:hypothetical protein
MWNLLQVYKKNPDDGCGLPLLHSASDLCEHWGRQTPDSFQHSHQKTSHTGTVSRFNFGLWDPVLDFYLDSKAALRTRKATMDLRWSENYEIPLKTWMLREGWNFIFWLKNSNFFASLNFLSFLYKNLPCMMGWHKIPYFPDLHIFMYWKKVFFWPTLLLKADPDQRFRENINLERKALQPFYILLPSNHLMSSYFLHKIIFFSIICEGYPMFFLWGRVSKLKT